jgi:DNA-binding FrmR family transcriptional regulator
METHEDTRPTRGYAGDKDQLLRRIRRLEGQVRGVGKMVEDDRYCIDIVNQISAIQAAAREISLKLLEGHVRHCVAEAVREDNAEPKLAELVETLGRAMGR